MSLQKLTLLLYLSITYCSVHAQVDDAAHLNETSEPKAALVRPGQMLPDDIALYTKIQLIGDDHLAKEILQSTALTTLDLLRWENAEVPDSIQYIPNLTRLSIRESAITTLGSWIGNCKKLEVLEIIGCPNLRELPKEIGSLPNLNTLTVRNCSNVEEIPAEWSNLTALRSLTIDCHNLKRVPKDLWKIDSLKFVELNVAEFPEGIHTTPNLSTLTVVGKFEHMKVDFGNALKLKTLSVTAPLQSFECRSTSLEMLSLNAGTLSVRGNLLDHFPNARSIAIICRTFTEPLSIDSHKKLQKLYLQINSGKAFRVNGASEQLDELSITGRILEEISGLEPLENLKSLIIQRTRLTTIPPEVAGLKNLRHLSVMYSGLTEIPDFVFDRPLLEELNFQGNNINTPISEKIHSLEHLKWLNVSANAIPNIDELRNKAKFKIWPSKE